MFIKNKDLFVLEDTIFYLNNVDDDKAQELKNQLVEIVENLVNKRSEKNIVNTKRINEKRKLDKNYARSKKDIQLPLF